MVATGGGGASADAPALGGSNSASAGTETGGSGAIPVCLEPAAIDNTGTSPIIDFETTSDYGSMTALGTVTGTIRADTDGNNAYVLSGSGNPGDQGELPLSRKLKLRSRSVIVSWIATAARGASRFCPGARCRPATAPE